MALEIKKPWGQSGHPWLSIPITGWNLWMTPVKIKIKEVKVKKSFHMVTLRIYKTYPVGIVKRKFDLVVVPSSSLQAGMKNPAQGQR
ncbi:MAG: hypothetical protein AB1502_16255 [Thermodesulfobacteriota bacterium]